MTTSARNADTMHTYLGHYIRIVNTEEPGTPEYNRAQAIVRYYAVQERTKPEDQVEQDVAKRMMHPIRGNTEKHWTVRGTLRQLLI